MIDQIKIENFQSHKKTTLDLHSGVNVIVGESDQGKTSILRALNWLVNNQPSGAEFQSDFMIKKGKQAETTSVEIKVDGETIKRERKGTIINQYQCSFEHEPFKAIGKNVPDKIADFINMSDINFQQQIGLPFLLASSPTDIAKYLNKIVNLDVITTSLKNIRSQVFNLNREKESIAAQINKKENDLDTFQWVDTAAGEIQILSNTQQQINTNKSTIIQIEEKIKQIHQCTEIIKETAKILPAKKQIEKLNKIDNELLALDTKWTKIDKAIDTIKTTQQFIKQYTKILKAKKDTEKLTEMLNTLTQTRTRYTALLLKHNTIKNKLEHLNAMIEDAAKLNIELKEKLPDTCPLCKQEISFESRLLT